MDDDALFFGGLYENGHWLWDEKLKKIEFISNQRSKGLDDMLRTFSFTAPTTKINFREDVDLIEQMRYRRYYQRKVAPGQTNIVHLQDVKDLVIYTAPVNIINIKLINMLHTRTTDRFLRALILYCAYSLQITEELTQRNLDLALKVRTSLSEELEDEFLDNLSDLRVLVAKEYSSMLCGAGDMKPYHHMGPHKRRQSLQAKDAKEFETFLRICVQIVYIALGRRYFNQIEIETHRLLKSAAFNAVGHKLQGNRAQGGYTPLRRLSDQDRTQAVLHGKCLRYDKQLNTHSPLMNEVFCSRPIDYRMMGLGVVKYQNLTTRLHYLKLAVAGPEDTAAEENIIIGIIGMPRSRFDIMLKILPMIDSSTETKSKSLMSQQFMKSVTTVKKSIILKPYPDIIIPPKEAVETSVPKNFDEVPEDNFQPVNQVQRRIWISKLKAMMSLVTQSRRRGRR